MSALTDFCSGGGLRGAMPTQGSHIISPESEEVEELELE